MSRDDDKPEEGYEVGYKKPPRHTQFKPGESGRSRRRRPPGQRPMTTPRTLHEVVRKAARRTYKVKDGDRMREVPLSDLVVQRVLQNALTTKNSRDLRYAVELLVNAKAFGERPPTLDEIVASLTREEFVEIEKLRNELKQFDTPPFGDDGKPDS